MRQQVGDAFNRHVSWTVGVRVERVLTLAGKNRGDAVAPGLLDRGQDSRFVVTRT